MQISSSSFAPHWRVPRLRLCLVLFSVFAYTSTLAWAQTLRLVETEKTIVVEQSGVIVLAYNKVSPEVPEGIDPIHERSGFLHPVSSPQAKVVTAMFPFDHAHQHGIFSAWVNTTYDGRDVDFWNLAGGTGRVLHDLVVRTFETADATGFEVDLVHRTQTKPIVDILHERWKVTAYPTDGSYHCFDIQTEQTAVTEKPLTINKYHYGGFAFRGPISWLTAKDSGARKNAGMKLEQNEFLTSLGSDRLNGNHEHVNWVSINGSLEDKPVSIAVLSHANNFRAPQSARLHPSKPYFCFAPCVDGEFVIDRDHPLTGQYRFLIADRKIDAEWIDKKWSEWCSE